MKTLPASTKMDDANFSRVYRHITVPPDVTVEDLQRPGFWIHHGSKLNRFDLIDVIASDGSLDVQLRVDLVEKGLPWMRVLRQYVRVDRVPTVTDEAAETVRVPSGYIVDQDASGGWRARTKHPVIVLASGLLTRDEAMLTALDHAEKAGNALNEEPSRADGAGDVAIPDGWRDLNWQEKRSLASKLTNDPIRNGEDANEAIKAELALRAAE